MKTARIKVDGIVQGVGFRPNIYRLATALKLKGYVKNLGNIVEIVVQGEESVIKQFLDDVKIKTPPIAKINNINVEWDIDTTTSNYNNFQIYESSDEFSGTSVIPADIATCDDCLDDMNNPTSSRHNYPFTACTDCGPRFTVIKSLPYDRDKTTMDEFPLCDKCMVEYTNPLDRRYHAEASCCVKCGPKLSLFVNNWKKKSKTEKSSKHNVSQIKTNNPIKTVAELLDSGKILAIKGIGGTHLVANATDEIAIKTMRKRLKRFNQPFAVMSKDLDTIKTYAEISSQEKKAISSNRRPIVVLKKSKDYDFPEELAPDLHTIGVMLPYAPLHHILFKYTKSSAYIMTSANMPGEPMMISNSEIIENLGEISDYFLLHNRKIANRCDDSVVRFRNGELSFIRRSRGYTPEPHDLSYLKNLNNSNNPKNSKNILSLGPELDVTFAITKSDLNSSLCYVSQHIGNTNKFRTYEFLKDAINHLMEITKTNNFDIITHDLH
ncbi:MAG: carbamoyltransferase HypF, partial [Methanobacteriaceae archaeon]